MDLFAVFLTIALALYATESYSRTMNDFNLDGALIPVKEIRKGGPPRDGIPAINDNLYFFDWGHPNDLGHRWYAREMAPYIERVADALLERRRTAPPKP